MLGIIVLFGLTSAKLERFEYSQVHMGVSIDLTMYSDSKEHAERAAKAAFLRFAELDGIMSDYKKDSELNRLALSPVDQPVKLSRDLATVLVRAQELSQLSNGAFDITAGPLIRRWRTVRDDRMLPWRTELLNLKSQVGWQYLRVDASQSTATLSKAGLKLDLGGIAKGYACDAALSVLKKEGIRSAMVRAGGDIAVSAAPPGRSHWTIEVRGWKEPLFVREAGVSTSGDTEQFVEIGGRRYSHIIDPRTGYALTSQIQVTVISPNAFTSDGISTACSVLGMSDRSDELAERFSSRLVFVEGVQPLRMNE